MASKWFGSLAGLIASAGLALAQTGPVSMQAYAPMPAGDSTHVIPANHTVGLHVDSPSCCGASATADHMGSCSEGCGDGGSRLWVNAEYLVWWTKNGHLPTIIGTIPTALAGMNPLPPDSISTVF